MKKIIHIYLIASLLIYLLNLTSCTSTKKVSYFSNEYSCLDFSPDSIYKILLDKSDSLSLWSKQKQADYWLTRLLAQDKCYIPLESDSLPIVLEEFFYNNNQNIKAATAKYLQCEFLIEKGDYPRALNFLLKTIRQYDIPKNEAINGHIYGTIAYIYDQIENSALSQKYYQKALEAYINANDSTLLPSALVDLANCYLYTKPDTIFSIFKQAKTLANVQGLDKRVRSINMSLANAYLTVDSLESAYRIIQELKSNSELSKDCTPKPIRDQFDLLQGEYYILTKQYEKATEIYDTLSTSERAQTTLLANSILAQLANARGKYKKANKYYRNFLATHDSIMSQKNLDSTHKYQALYDYHVAQEKENQAKQELKQAQLIFSYLVAGITVCVSLIIILIIYSKNRKIQENHRHIEEATNKYLMAEENILEAQKEMNRLKDKHKTSQQEINQLKDKHETSQQEMSRLKDKHKTSQQKIDEQVGEIQRMEKHLIEAKEQVKFALGNKVQTEKKITLHPDYHLLHQDTKLKEELFKGDLRDRYLKLVDHFYPNFRQNILTLYPKIADYDLLLCYLLKLDVPMNQAANHLGRNRSTVSKARKRIAERCGLDPKTNALEEIIKKS